MAVVLFTVICPNPHPVIPREHKRFSAPVSMTYLVFYFGAFALFCAGAFCSRKTSALGRVGGAEYEKRRKRKVIANVLMVAATVSLATGIITQLYSGNPTELGVPSTSTQAVPSSAASATAALPQGFQVATNSVVLSSPLTKSGNDEPISTSTHAVLPSVAPATTSLPQGFQIATTPATLSSPLVNGDEDQPSASPTIGPFAKAAYLLEQKQYDAALEQASVAIQGSPQNPAAYSLRGDIYAATKRWDRAESDYQTALLMDSTNNKLKFNLAEIAFAQKKYDAARARFGVLQQDPLLGDLAQYHVFLCDLLGGHEDAAAKEFDAFNRAGSNASYYFANAAWSLYHQKKDDARDWLTSAAHIYEPFKYKLYADSLIEINQR
jgi:Tfp pilus assembly protein PilF